MNLKFATTYNGLNILVTNLYGSETIWEATTVTQDGRGFQEARQSIHEAIFAISAAVNATDETGKLSRIGQLESQIKNLCECVSHEQDNLRKAIDRLDMHQKAISELHRTLNLDKSKMVMTPQAYESLMTRLVSVEIASGIRH